MTLISFLQDNWAAIAGVMLAVLTLLNRLLKSPAEQTWIHALIDLLSAMPKAGQSARLVGSDKPLTLGWKVPLLMKTHTTKSQNGLSVVALLIAIALGASACAYCKLPANAGKVQCQMEVITVKCGEPAIEQAAIAALPLVLQALSGDSADWGALLKLEEQYGIEAIMCAVHAADSAQASKVRKNAKAVRRVLGK